MQKISRTGLHEELHNIVHHAPVYAGDVLSHAQVEHLIKLKLVGRVRLELAGVIKYSPTRYAPTRAGVERLARMDEIAVERAAGKIRGCSVCGYEVTPDALIIAGGSCPGCGVA